jgi:single-stranded-DNA-specific exonuclease
MSKWLDPEPVRVLPTLRDAAGGHPLVAETLARRGVLTPEAARAFLDPGAYTPAPPADLPDMDVAVERLRGAILLREPIIIWGDFDADGQTATALLLQVLGALGAEVTFHVPGRREGHGLHKRGLERLVAEGARLILTCDTGVTAHAAVAHANARGAAVIITDHHVPFGFTSDRSPGQTRDGPGEDLPSALAVINPHRLPPGHPMDSLTGVGVAYELAKALNPTVADRALDLVALGMVADVATLRGDTRYLVQRGLETLRHTDRPGLQAIYQIADLRPEGLTEEHIGFVLGPRLNALGRLADAADGVELLTTKDPARARVLATQVEGLNARRQWLTRQVADAALAQIEREPSLLDDYHALVLSHSTWPSGVIGIVAGRLAERFGKPVVLVAAPEGELARASGRSIPGVDLFAALSDCAPLLESFGGHPGAAGFSIEPERLPALRAALSRAVAAGTETLAEPRLGIDAYVEIPDLTLELVSELNRLAPFGRGNPPLTLAVNDLRVLSEATIGRTREHRRVTLEDAQERTLTVFWWQGAGWPLPQGRFDLALTVRANDYRGVADIQVEWLDAREREPVTVEVEAEPAIRVRDYRTVSNPEVVLHGLVAEGDVLVWGEGASLPGVKVRSRRQLVSGLRLVVWTLPPGPGELWEALARVQPEEVILFAHDPGLDDAAQPGEATRFLRRLAGLVKFALQAREGQVDLEAAAAVVAQRVSAVQAGLDWLAAQGQVAIVEKQDDCWRLAAGSGHLDSQVAGAALARVDAVLVETAAYRAYARSAPAAALIKGQPQIATPQGQGPPARKKSSSVDAGPDAPP